MRWLLWLLAAVLGALMPLVFFLMILGPAKAHGLAMWIKDGPYFSILIDQPTVHCCGVQDCQPWPESDVSVTPQGYRLHSTGETIPFDETLNTEPRQIAVSPYWRCRTAGDITVRGQPYPAGRTRCFFAPASSA